MIGETSQTGTAAPHALTQLRQELAAARDQTDQLFRAIQPSALFERPIDERHRLIFYLGHLEAFDWNLLARKGLDAPSFHPAFDKLFERGIDPTPGSATKDLPSDWPDRHEIEAYNSKTRNWIDSHLIYTDPCLVQMAIEHRHMHAETTAYLLHALDYSEKQFPRSPAPLSGPTPANPLIEIPAGTAHLGTGGNGFAWDNERHAHQITVPSFRISRFKVSNGEYLAFVRQGAPAPHFWVQRNGEWFFHGMFTEIPLPLDWPVWVMWDEAAAYAKFCGLVLPSEAQFHRASTFTPPDPIRDNFGYQRWDPIPVNSGACANPWPHQLTGNGWEWTRDVFAPFAGFEPHPAYPGYSADFFDDPHYVMKGASPRTATVLTRPGFRNWFRPNYPHMYAGFRLIAP